MDGVLFRTSLTECLFWNPLINMPQKQSTYLMIVDPDRYIKTFADLGANILSVHYACTHLHRTLQAIKAEGMKAVAINPTPTLTS
jgi:pentose-5-phosphate-3-epimerase